MDNHDKPPVVEDSDKDSLKNKFFTGLDQQMTLQGLSQYVQDFIQQFKDKDPGELSVVVNSIEPLTRLIALLDQNKDRQVIGKSAREKITEALELIPSQSIQDAMGNIMATSREYKNINKAILENSSDFKEQKATEDLQAWYLQTKKELEDQVKGATDINNFLQYLEAFMNDISSGEKGGNRRQEFQDVADSIEPLEEIAGLIESIKKSGEYRTVSEQGAYQVALKRIRSDNIQKKVEQLIQTRDKTAKDTLKNLFDLMR